MAKISIFLVSRQRGGVLKRSAKLYDVLIKNNEVDFIYLSEILKTNRLNCSSIFNYWITNFTVLREKLKQSEIVVSFSLLPNLINSIISPKSVICITGSAWIDRNSSITVRLYWSLFFQPLSILLSNRIVPASPVVLPNYAKKIGFIRKKVREISGFIDYMELWREFSKEKEQNCIHFPYFIFIGSLDRHKGCMESIRIYHKAIELLQSPLPPLMICGDGKEFVNAYKLCEKLKINVVNSIPEKEVQNTVAFLGDIENIYSLMKGSSLLIAPSYNEGLSNAIIEALYFSIPIISTAHKSNKFILNSAKSTLAENKKLKMKLLPFPCTNNKITMWAIELLKLKRLVNYEKSTNMPIIINSFSAKANSIHWYNLIKELSS